MGIKHPSVGGLLTRLVDGQTQALGVNLVGTYLFGSVVTGDFEPGISDVDTVAVVLSDLTATQLAALERLHRDIVEEMPQWEDRVEVVYLSSLALATFRRNHASQMRGGESSACDRASWHLARSLEPPGPERSKGMV